MNSSKNSLDDSCNIVHMVEGENGPRCCCHDTCSQLARMREELDRMMETGKAGRRPVSI